MSVAAVGSVSRYSYQPKAAAASAATYAAADGPPLSSASLNLVSDGALPRVRLTADQLAQIQQGPQPPDPAKAAAETSTPAYAIVKNAQTGEVLGGVWPGVANVSAPAIASDPRLSGGSPAEQTQALAQDIAQATGNAVTIQYFQPGDPSTPTFGSDVIGSYWS